MTQKLWTKLFTLAGIAVMAAGAQASLLDATVLIERGANNRTLTVRYNGAAAALVEFRLNGQSIATRSMDDARNGGETSFNVDTASLEEGDNAIEIRLYNADGKVLASQKSTFKVDRRGTGPVFLEKPRAGATVSGPVEIKLGLRQEMKNLYVSFFVNDELKSLRNFAPYVFLWDTEREKNGWHEVQAWVVDGDNNTYRTDRMRLFVANGGGRTNRVDSAPLTTNSVSSTTAGSELKTSATGSGSSTGAAINTAVTPGSTNPSPASLTVAKAAPAAPVATSNIIAPARATLSGTKGSTAEEGSALGTQNLNPGTKVAPMTIPGYEVSFNRSLTTPIVSTAMAGSLAPVAVEYGTRLPEVGAFQVMLDNRYVNFDVNPRVEKGVPFTPFRHLFQEAGGSVHWEAAHRTVRARGMGKLLWFRVGDDVADVNGSSVRFEIAPFIESGRVLVPMSFMVDALNIRVQYDPNTGHVLVTTEGAKKG
jgi:hypothetical protein